MKQSIPTKVEPEPKHPFDSRAVTFKCLIDNKWQTIGYIYIHIYVIKELYESVHNALSSDSIASTKLAWVKYKIVCTTGPGYYAAVDVTFKGAWPLIVKRSASTMY